MKYNNVIAKDKFHIIIIRLLNNDNVMTKTDQLKGHLCNLNL